MRLAAIFFLLFFLRMGAASAQSAPVFLEELTWMEVREATRAGKSTILIPIGGTEQNGPHMVLGKHNTRVKFLSGKIAAALGNALVAPVLAYVPEGQSSPPTAHMRFPGTITVPEPVFEAILESAARGFRLHGFKDVVFLGDHGGYQKSLQRAAATLNREWAKTSVRAHPIEEYHRAGEVGFAQILKNKGFGSEEIGTHAGLGDTSLALAVDPALVRAEKLTAPNKGKADGLYGDPRRATAELGKMGLDLVVDSTVEAIRQAISRR